LLLEVETGEKLAYYYTGEEINKFCITRNLDYLAYNL